MESYGGTAARMSSKINGVRCFMNQFESAIIGFLIALGWRYVLAIYLGDSDGRLAKTEKWILGLGLILAMTILWRRLVH